MDDDERPPSKPRSALQPRSPDGDRAARSSLIERLFARFLAIYGARYARQWAGADPNELKAAWDAQLAGIPLDQIGRAVALCAKEVANPPTLPEFLAVVRQCYVPPPAPEFAPTQGALPPVTLREFHEQQREIAQRSIEQCKAILRSAAARSMARSNAVSPVAVGVDPSFSKLADRALKGIDESAEAEAERQAIIAQSALRAPARANLRVVKPHRQRTGART